MIRLEDPEFEKFSLEEGDIAVPVEIYLPAKGGEAEITVYSAFRQLAEELSGRFGDNILSPEASAVFFAELQKRMAEYGFVPSPDSDNCIREYVLENAADLRRECILEGTRIVRENGELESLKIATTHELLLDEEENEVCAIHEVDGVIAAYAALNDPFMEEESAEISVECAPAYRRSGFASSCASKLSAWLLENGMSVRYHCRSGNAVSARVAEKAGFTLEGTRCSFVYYRKGLV